MCTDITLHFMCSSLQSSDSSCGQKAKQQLIIFLCTQKFFRRFADYHLLDVRLCYIYTYIYICAAVYLAMCVCLCVTFWSPIVLRMPNRMPNLTASNEYTSERSDALNL